MNNNSTLLSILKGLYSQLGQILLVRTQTRIDSYQRNFKSDMTIDITTILNRQVDDLAARVVTERVEIIEVSEERHEKLPEKNTELHQIPYKNYPETKHENMSGVESEFANYLKQRKMTSVTQPHLGENLKASAWEHIHCAIRHAKNGALDTAKLHTSIAGTALEEAGDFMEHDDYVELICEVEQYFNEPRV